MTEIAERTDASAVDLATASLRDVENYIAPRLRGFVEAGYALMAVRERRLYLKGGFDTFEGYCRDRWGIEAAHARRMCDAAQVAHIAAASTNAPGGLAVENEAQARELAPLLGKPDELREVWEKTAERAERTGQRVTAPMIRQVRREHEQARHVPPAPAPRPAPSAAPRPALVQIVPIDGQRVFNLVTQAAEEARALGGEGVFRGAISADVRQAWAVELAAAAEFFTQLAETCRTGT